MTKAAVTWQATRGEVCLGGGKTARISALPLSTPRCDCLLSTPARFTLAQTGQRDDPCHEALRNLANVSYRAWRQTWSQTEIDRAPETRVVSRIPNKHLFLLTKHNRHRLTVLLRAPDVINLI
jgi:hypothetical protein